MALQDWTNVATIVGALGSFMVAVAALVVSVAALRTQREALPVSAVFGITGRGYVDTNGVRWMQAWMQNTGVMVYVHEVYRSEWLPLGLTPDALVSWGLEGFEDFGCGLGELGLSSDLVAVEVDGDLLQAA